MIALLAALAVGLSQSTLSAGSTDVDRLEQKWAEIVQPNQRSAEELADIAYNNTVRSTEMIRSGQRDEGIALSVSALVINRYIADNLMDDDAGRRRFISSLRESQEALVEAGVSIDTLNDNARAFQHVLGLPPADVFSPPRPRPVARDATSTERRVMLAEIRSNLIDPTSPIFGRSYVVGDTGCVVVNSKNRFGGYTGNQVAVLAHSDELGEWALGGIADMPLEACLATGVDD